MIRELPRIRSSLGRCTVAIAAVFLSGTTAVVNAAASQTSPTGRPSDSCAVDVGRRIDPVALHRWAATRQQELLRQYGSVEDTAMLGDVELVLGRLQRAASHPGLVLTPLVLRRDALGAGALPGGVVIVYDGALRRLRALSDSMSGNDRAAARERYLNYVGMLLGHEVAHLTLGHTAALADERPAARTTSRAGFESEGRLDSLFVAARAARQACEASADRIGALYLVRAGWQIERGLELFRAMHEIERANTAAFRDAASLGTVRTHQSPVLREAGLERFRAELKTHQQLFDDAVRMIHANMELPLAVQLLDSVIAVFPELVAARHARGTAYHRQWLNTVSIAEQQLRSDLLTVDALPLRSIRGTAGDTALLVAARKDYEWVLQREPLPETRSHHALVLAFSGDTDGAVAEARRALTDGLRLARPGAPSRAAALHNNLGIAVYLSGDRGAALGSFQAAVDSSGGTSRPALFNVARTLHTLGDTARATAAIARYVRADPASPWSRFAQAGFVAGDASRAAAPGDAPRAPAPAPTVPAAATTDDDAPTVRGIALGDGPGIARRALRLGSGSGDILRVDSLGLVVILQGDKGVRAFILKSAASGDLRGVHVGSPQAVLVSAFDAPDQVLSEPGEEHWHFHRGDWALSAVVRDRTVMQLGLRATR